MPINLSKSIFKDEKQIMDNATKTIVEQDGVFFALDMLSKLKGYTDHKAQYNIGRMIGQIKRERELYQKKQQEIVKKYSELNEHGDIVLQFDDKGNILGSKLKDKDSGVLLQEDINKLALEEFCIESYPLQFTDFAGVYQQIPPKTFADIEVLMADYQHEKFRNVPEINT